MLPGAVFRGFDDVRDAAEVLGAVARGEPTYVIGVHVSAFIKHLRCVTCDATQVANAI
jgi:hypothetical protein